MALEIDRFKTVRAAGPGERFRNANITAFHSLPLVME